VWIDHPAIQSPLRMPDTATASVTIRRWQQFKIEHERTYAWHWSRDGRVLASGKVTPDAVNLLTIPNCPFRPHPPS